MRFESSGRWALGLGLGMLAAVAGGMMAGNDTVAEMDPFYANLASRSHGTPRDAEIVDASFVAPSEALPDTSDLSYGRGRADDVGYATADMR